MPPGDVLWPMHRVAAPSTASGKSEHHATHSAVPQSFHYYGGTYSFGGLAEIHSIPLHSLYGKKGLFQVYST